MEMGLSLFSTEQSGPVGDIAREAERLGFESLWFPEHMLIPVRYQSRYKRTPDGKVPESFAHLPDPFIGAAMAAQATERLRVATGICILPQRDVIATAKAAAMRTASSSRALMMPPSKAVRSGISRMRSGGTGRSGLTHT